MTSLSTSPTHTAISSPAALHTHSAQGAGRKLPTGAARAPAEMEGPMSSECKVNHILVHEKKKCVFKRRYLGKHQDTIKYLKETEQKIHNTSTGHVCRLGKFTDFPK